MDDSMEIGGYNEEEEGGSRLGTLEGEFHDALGAFEKQYREVESGAYSAEQLRYLQKNLINGLEDICTSWSRESRSDKEAILYAEAVTWKLLSLRRAELDWSEHETVPAEEMVEKPVFEVLEDLEKDREFRRLECIVLWLEMQQQKKLEYYQDEIEASVMSMWPSTRGWIEDGDSRWGGGSFDPDAPYRRELARDGRVKKLHPLDETTDCTLLERVWRFIRAGRMEDAFDLCRRCGQAWRAASFSGGEPWSVVEKDGQYQRYNSVRSVQWRQMCYKMAKTLKAVEDKRRGADAKHRDSVVHWEWTVYAALASCPELLTQSEKCRSWEDQCWAFFHAKRECYLASKVREVRQERRLCSELYPDLVPDSLDAQSQTITTVDKLSIEEVFKKIEHIAGILRPERLAQASIIKSDLTQVLRELMDVHTLQGLRATRDRKDGLRRLLTHLGIYVKVALGRAQFDSLPPALQSRLHTLIEAYMDQLMTDPRHVKLTPLYASYLPIPAMHEKLADCLKAVVKTADRRDCLGECVIYVEPVLDIVINDILEHCRGMPVGTVRGGGEFGEVLEEASDFWQALLGTMDRERVTMGASGRGERPVLKEVRPSELVWIKALEWCHVAPDRISPYTLVHVNAFLRELVIRSARAAGGGGGALISDSFRVVIAYAESVLRVSQDLHHYPQLETFRHLIWEWKLWKAYGRAQDAYLEWSSVHAKLTIQLETLENMQKDGTLTAELSASVWATAALGEMEKLVANLWEKMRGASEEIRAILTDPDQLTWTPNVRPGQERTRGLVDAHIFDRSRADIREAELKRLRATCLPELVAMLERVYFHTGESIEKAFLGQGRVTGESLEMEAFKKVAEECYLLSLKVSEVLMTPQYSVFTSFPKGTGETDGSYLPRPVTLEEMMKRIEKSSLALLAITNSTQWAPIAKRVKDKFGY